MITENIIVAVITGLFAFAGVALSNYTANRKNTIEQVKRDTKIEDKKFQNGRTPRERPLKSRMMIMPDGETQKDTTHIPYELLPFPTSPCNGHEFYIGYHLAPILSGFTA